MFLMPRGVIVDNYLSSERLDYPKDGPSITAIVIGGNTLYSRPV